MALLSPSALSYFKTAPKLAYLGSSRLDRVPINTGFGPGALDAHHLVRPVQSDRLRVNVLIVCLVRNASPIPHNHARCSNGVQVVDEHVVSGTASLDTENLRLTVLRSRIVGTRSAVTVEEAVETGTIIENVLTVQDAEPKGVTVAGEAVGICRVVERGVCSIRASLGVRRWLPVTEKGVSLHERQSVEVGGQKMSALTVSPSG